MVVNPILARIVGVLAFVIAGAFLFNTFVVIEKSKGFFICHLLYCTVLSHFLSSWKGSKSTIKLIYISIHIVFHHILPIETVQQSFFFILFFQSVKRGFFPIRSHILLIKIGNVYTIEMISQSINSRVIWLCFFTSPPFTT